MNPHYSASMQTDRTSLAIFLLVILMSPATTVGQIVDFEDYGLPPGKVIDFGSGEAWTSCLLTAASLILTSTSSPDAAGPECDTLT